MGRVGVKAHTPRLYPRSVVQNNAEVAAVIGRSGA